MKKSLIEIYALAVCFICAVIFSIFVSVGIYSIFEVTNPEFTMAPYDHTPHSNNEKFLEHKLSSIPKDYDNPYKNMSQQQLTEARERSFQLALEKERRGGRQSLLQTLIAAFVLTLMFGIHWTIAKKARRSNNASLSA